jgi:Raf kinase inhibitor-like YbhB/YbcL family protein
MRTARITLALMLVFVAVALVPAQTPPPAAAAAVDQAAGQRAGGPPPQTPPAGRRGGGRGRGAVQIMTLTAPWAPGAEIPMKYTQAGGDISPALSWDNVPETAVSFALIVHDVSAAAGQGTDDVLHWMVWNIPAAARSLPEGVPQGAQMADGSRQISVTGPNYRGPGAPASGPPHVYLFELYALDSMIDVPAVGATGTTVPQTRAAVLAAMATHVRGKAVTAGVFKRPAS